MTLLTLLLQLPPALPCLHSTATADFRHHKSEVIAQVDTMSSACHPHADAQRRHTEGSPTLI